MLKDIKNVVFDIGRVLVSFEPLEYLNKTYEEDLSNFLFKEVFSSKEWLELDRGTISPLEAIEMISARTENKKEYKKYIGEVINGFSVILRPIKSSVGAVKLLKDRGYKLYLLSNFHKDAFDQIVKENDFFNLFEGGIISSDHKFLKPEKEIYELLIKNYDLTPEQTLFIDDTLKNIEVAEEIGFNTIHFKDGLNLYKLFNKS